MKKNIWAAILLISLLTAAATVGCGRKQDRLNELLDLGQRYLTEENYEQAAVAFEKAIDIDEKCVRAYTGLADAYAGQGNTKKAAEILQKGYDITNDQTLLDKREEVLEAGALEDPKNEEGGSEGNGLENDADDGGGKGEVTELPATPELELLKAFLESGDYSQISWEQLETLVESVTPPAVLVITGDPLGEGGTGIGLYYVQETDLCAVYYGDYIQSERSGHGVWTWGGGNFYEGDWSEDAPNGRGMVTWDSGMTETGSLSDGKWDGQMTISSVGTWNISFQKGLPVIQGKVEGADDPDNTLIISTNSDEYCCTQAQAKTPWGIPGFVPQLPNPE